MYRRAVRADVPIDFICPPCESAVGAQADHHNSDVSWGLQSTTSAPGHSTMIAGAQAASEELIDVSAVTQHDVNDNTQQQNTSK